MVPKWARNIGVVGRMAHHTNLSFHSEAPNSRVVRCIGNALPGNVSRALCYRQRGVNQTSDNNYANARNTFKVQHIPNRFAMFSSEVANFALSRTREIAVAQTMESSPTMHHTGESHHHGGFQGRKGSIDRLRLRYQKGLMLTLVKRQVVP
jgi:hypothetical protein